MNRFKTWLVRSVLMMTAAAALAGCAVYAEPGPAPGYYGGPVYYGHAYYGGGYYHRY